MLLSFCSFVKTYQQKDVDFCQPTFINEEIMKIEEMKSIWTMEKFQEKSTPISITIERDHKALIFLKDVNSFDQNNLLLSIGYMTILGQIGCYVPA